MRIIFYVALAILITGCSSKPDNFAECILNNMPGVSNEITRSAVHRTCRADFPMMYEIKKGSGLGFFSDFKNKDQCVIEKNKSTLNRNAAANISRACSCLYGEPSSSDEMCVNPFLNPDYGK